MAKTAERTAPLLKARAAPVPESIELPGYVRDRDAQATRAGLRLERLTDPCRYVDNIITHYHGSKEQICASGFVADDFRWPSTTSHPITRGVSMFSPSCRSDYGGRVHLNTDGTFRLVLKEDCPRSLMRLGPELERYELRDIEGRLKRDRHVVVSAIVHYGSEPALLAAGIVKDEDYAQQAPNGWWIHTRDLRAERQAEQRKQEERLPYQSPDQFREHFEALMVVRARLLAKRMGAVETRQGYRYALDPAMLQEVINAIEVAAQGLRNVPVKVKKLVSEEAQATARESSARASNDANFQRFIDRLLHNGERPQE